MQQKPVKKATRKPIVWEGGCGCGCVLKKFKLFFLIKI
jgi:hypothetical protein